MGFKWVCPFLDIIYMVMALLALVLLIILAFSLCFGVPFITVSNAQTSYESAYGKLSDAFTLVQEADVAGGDVSGLVAGLNEALELIFEANSVSSIDPSRAEELYILAECIVDEVILEAPLVRESGLVAQQQSMVYLSVGIVVLEIISFLIYRYGPELFWNLWLCTHRDWKVR